MFIKKLCLGLFILIQVLEIQSQSGPDPWEQNRSKTPGIHDKGNLPPDLRFSPKRKAQTENKLGISEWFFKRILTIVLKGGQTKVDEDGSVDISLQMRFDTKQWEVLSESMKSDSPLSEDMLRRTVGYVQESIYKPTIVEKISMAWSDYIEIYLTEYKAHITWTLGFLGAAGTLFWLWSHLSHKHVYIIIFLIFYAYESVISYKEAEKKEMEIFIAAVNSCKWYFWMPSQCHVPSPDPLVFIKHMNPQKIIARMFSTALAEPLYAFNEVIEVTVSRLTDDLYYPFNSISYAVLVVGINICLIIFFFMIIFNWVLNIPFNISFLWGLFGIGIQQRHRNLFSGNNNSNETTRTDPVPIRHNEEAERISPTTINRILDVCTLALASNAQNRHTQNRADLNQIPTSNPLMSSSSNVPIRRSASTGRLNLKSTERFVTNNLVPRRPLDGSGDAR